MPRDVAFICLKLEEKAKPLYHKRRFDAGFDVYLPEDINLGINETVKIGLGITMTQCPPYLAILMLARSSTGDKGVLVNSPLIDPNYRGEWHVVLTNVSNRNVAFKAGDRIAQVIFTPIMPVYLRIMLADGTEQVIDTYENSAFVMSVDADDNRGTDGFGASGK